MYSDGRQFLNTPRYAVFTPHFIAQEPSKEASRIMPKIQMGKFNRLEIITLVKVTKAINWEPVAASNRLSMT